MNAKDIATLDEFKKSVMSLVRLAKKFAKLSEKRSGMSFQSHTQKAIQNAESSLNWHAMEYDKLKRDAHALAVDCGLADPRDAEEYGPVDYHPSGWHHYRFQPRIPKCRQQN